MRWWRKGPERRESYGSIVASALHDAALGSVGAPRPQETSTVLACCRMWSATTSSLAVAPDDGPLSEVLPEVGWRLGRFGFYAARLEDGRLRHVDRYRRLPSGWYHTETDRDDRTARAVISPDALLVIELPGRRAPWRSSGAEALAGLDRALAIDSRKPIGLALGSGLEGSLDLGAVVQTLSDAWESDFKQGSVIISDGRPTAAHTGPSADLLTGAARIRPDLSGSVLDCYGVPRSLFLASGSNSREALRLFVATTGSWLASLTERAARRVLDENLTVDATRRNTPADAVSRARAVHSLAQAGVHVDEALRLAGLE